MSNAVSVCPANPDEEIRNDLLVNGTTQGSVPEQLPLGDEQKCGEMQHYFVRKIVLSTSSCVLTLAYAMLVNCITSRTDRRNLAGGVPYNLCMLSAFLAVALHAGMITLSGPGAVLCRHQGDMNGQRRRAAALFTRITIACEYLHIGGTALLALAVFVSSFIIFEDLTYSGIFCVLWASSLAMFVPGQYRDASLNYLNPLSVVGTDAKAPS